MKHELKISEYFKGNGSTEASRPKTGAPFVTISRQAGAGGRDLADAIIARLAKERGPHFAGWQVYDRALCERVASDPNLRVSLESLLTEEFHAGLDDYLRSALGNRSPQIKIDRQLFRTVRSVCAVGKAIVIGRAAAFVTKDLPGGVHVRLVSRREARAERLARQLNLPPLEAKRRVDERDDQRTRFVEHYFLKDPADPLMYDCVWNMDAVPAEAIAEALLVLIKKRAAPAR